MQIEEKEPENVTEERQKTPDAEPPAPPQTTRVLLASSSDEEPTTGGYDGADEPKPEDIPVKLRWMYEHDFRQEKPKDETPEEKERREHAREVRRKRRKNREERLKEIERQRAEVTNPEEYDSDVVTDPEVEDKEKLVDNEIPKMVLIEIDNVRMLYPSKLICVTLDDDRQMLEAVGLKTAPIPAELQFPIPQNTRRSRVRNVVSLSNPTLQLNTVLQYCQTELRKRKETLKTFGNKGRNIALHQKPSETFLTWGTRDKKFSGIGLDMEDDQNIFLTKMEDPMIKEDGKGKEENENENDDDDEDEEGNEEEEEAEQEELLTFREIALTGRELLVERKDDFHAYHKKRMPKPLKERQKKSNQKSPKGLKQVYNIHGPNYGSARRRKNSFTKGNESFLSTKEVIKDKNDPPNATVRPDSDDEAHQIDKLSQQDWANFDEELIKEIPEIEIIEKEEIFNDVRLTKPPHDENYEPEPFLPITFLTNNVVNNDFEQLSGDEDMSEERFNEVFKDKYNKWKPQFHRGEKIECSNYLFDPSNPPISSPREYHLKEPPKKTKYESVIPTPIGNKYFKGSIVKNGLRGFEEMCIVKDDDETIRKERWLKRARRKFCKQEIKIARNCYLDLQKQFVKRSLKRALTRIRLTAEKDSIVEKPKREKPVSPLLKNKEDKSFEKSLVLMEKELDKLDMNSFCSQHEKAGPFGVPLPSGLIEPDYETSPHGSIDEESESEIDEQRTGLGEGTSDQYQEGDSVDMIQEDEEQFNDPSMEVPSISHIRTVGDHIGPDGMLSPPASNEMPKGGPLSVGPPSIEAQGLNQIYPTPPSVQMLQGDSAQAHSPGTHGKSRTLPIVSEEDSERITISGDIGSVVDVEVTDIETNNMQIWNKTTNQPKLSKFLLSSRNNPILSGRKMKYDTPMTGTFEIAMNLKKPVSGLAYEPMVTRNFEYAPHTSFAELIRVKSCDRRIPAPLSLPQMPSVNPGLMTPTHQLFQSPVLPPQHTPSPFSAGPLGHHPMVPPGYPGTPGTFPPTTPTYSGMTPRPGSTFGPGHVYPHPHHMGAPGYPGQMGPIGPMGVPPMGPMSVQRQFSNPQMLQHHQMQMRMQQMQQMRQMAAQGVPPGYGAPGMPSYPQGAATPGPMGLGMQSGPSSVQRLNNFVNQSQFGPSSVQSMQYGANPSMIPQSPNFNQPYGGMVNPMMSPMQQHQFHQQQMLQQQQHHQHQMQMQMQRTQLQLQHTQSQQAIQTLQPNPLQLLAQQNEQVANAHKNLSERDKLKFTKRQKQLKDGLMPTSLQPTAIKNLRNPPDANVPYKRHEIFNRSPDHNVPRGDSLTVAIVLSDTLLDLHFDSVFDACPICSCSVSIRSRDLGMYINPHTVLSSREGGYTNMREYTLGTWSGFHVNGPTTCTCGFSAIRHRYLSWCSGLFEEDADEATTSDKAVAPVIPPLDYPKKSSARDMIWFDSRSVHDIALIDQIRQMSFSNSLGKAVSQMATAKEHAKNLSITTEVTYDITIPSEYIMSHVDNLELLMLGNSALGPMQKSGTGNLTQVSNDKYLNYFHPWGFQTANEIVELDSSEWADLLGVVTPTLEVSMKQARHIPPETEFIIDGPLTWRQIVAKAYSGKPASEDEEDVSLAEPVPAVMRATEKEAIRAAPNIEQYYEQASLGPIDQPKDIMYLTIIPDDDDIYERTVDFMDAVTDTYETMRLGHHIPFPVSTGTATRFRNVYKSFQQQYPYTEHQQVLNYTNSQLRSMPQKVAGEPDPLDTNPANWTSRAKRKLEIYEDLRKSESEDGDYNPLAVADVTVPSDNVGKRNINSILPPVTSDKHSGGYYEREGILRVGKPLEPNRSQQTVVNTLEFENMTRHLSDANGFVSRLRLYLQQMEDLAHHALIGNPEAFERSGYRYQLAVEERLKREKECKFIEEERLRYEAARREDEQRVPEKPEEADLCCGVELGESTSVKWINDELEEKKRQRQKENEQYPPEGHQAPSPVPAGMIHIPETLSEQEKKVQPTLADIFIDPSIVAPLNAQNIAWKQRDTRVPNPFPSSNQPPIPFEAIGNADTDDFATLPHAIVIYVVNPFSYGTDGQSALHMRVALLSFIRAFNSIVGRLQYLKRPQVQLEIIGLESMDDSASPFPDYFNNPKVPFDILHERPVRNERVEEVGRTEITRSLCVAVYTHPRVFFPDIYKSMSARCMTAFGPGTQLINTINDIEKLNNDSYFRQAKRSKTDLDRMDAYRHPRLMPSHTVEKKNFIAYRVPSNILCLAPPPPVYQMDESGKPIVTPTDEQTLFISYCLVGKEYLVATATDAQGKLIDNCISNIKPRRKNNQVYRYSGKTQILDGMGKLWSFILGVMSSDIKNWRLVVGRLGRIGHGEFRAWTHLLNKSSLLKYSSSLKDICGACRSMPSFTGTPSILSACLITLEPEPSIRVVPEFYDLETMAKKSYIFHTPGDISCTHILTFPVGTEINLEMQDQTADTKAEENWEFGDLDIMEGLDDGDTEIMKDLGLETPSSAAIRQSGTTSFFSEDSSSIEIQNQPLASGYYISTAPAPELPSWFWATCPSAKRHSPVHLKSSLHINISEVKNDDIAMESTKEKDKEKEKEEKDIHPLESRQTEEVLRHVLESYNALSWLNLNRETGDRYSCLPIHIQHLLRLYHNVARLLA
uniref:Mediator of RNA polymerase II transcription subunit 13 n=1 Tax=Caenorhabditis tropicalis TaxID=1561998 RepID=A0A1I7UBP5_9PELO